MKQHVCDHDTTTHDTSHITYKQTLCNTMFETNSDNAMLPTHTV